MPRNVTKLKIFLASPGDTTEERKAVSEIVDELNRINSSDSMEFDLVKWETDAFPGVGEDAQDVINNQINDDYDIFIGLMWHRFGTPTKRAMSGTEEEFLRALEIHKGKLRSIKILFYFNQTPIPPRDIDIDQLQKVNQFKRQLSDSGVLYWNYNEIRELERFLRIQINKAAKELIDELNIDRIKIADPVVDSEQDGEPGLFDLMEQFTEDFTEVTLVLTRMTELMVGLGTKLNERATELNSVDSRTLKPQETKRLINKASNDMHFYVVRMNAEMPIFRRCMGNGFDSLTKAYAIFYADWGDRANEAETFGKVEGLYASMEGFKIQMSALKDKISSLPRATTEFNKAKKDTEKVIKELISEVDSALNQMIEIRRLRD